MIPVSMMFSTIAFIMSAVNQGGKRERGSEVGGGRQLNQAEPSSFPDTSHVWLVRFVDFKEFS